MGIDSGKTYRVRRFSLGTVQKILPNCDFGKVPGSYAKSILSRCEYDPEFDMWFPKTGSMCGYAVEEIN